VHESKLAANCLMGPVKFLAVAVLTTQIFRLSCYGDLNVLSAWYWGKYQAYALWPDAPA